MFKHLFLCGCALLAAFALLVSPAAAADLEAGAKVFTQNCAACHASGGNLLNSAKTLKKSDLEKYDMYSLEKIVTQVKKGKVSMPSFLGRLDETQITNVAAYVIDRADKGW